MIEKLIEQGVQSCSDANFEEGVKFFDQALSKKPDHLLALSNRARALSRVSRSVDALADFKRLIELQPQNPQFIGDYAVALHLNDQNEEARAMFDKALALEPQNPYRYSSRAFFKDRIGDSEGAIADYDQCIALDPEDAIALNNKGLVEEKMGYKEQSKQSFDKSNKLVGYEPKDETNSKGEILNPKFQKTNSRGQTSNFNSQEGQTKTMPQPPTKWQVIKSVFTKDGFKDFVKFSTRLIRK